MEKIIFNHTELKKAISLLYWAMPTKWAINKAAEIIGVSEHTMKKWYYGQTVPPRWHLKALAKLIKKAKRGPK